VALSAGYCIATRIDPATSSFGSAVTNCTTCSACSSAGWKTIERAA
jgi:hypothetical protein